MEDIKKRESFVFYRSFFESIERADDKEIQLQLYQAISRYALNGEEPQLSGMVASVWVGMKPQIDANIKRYINGCKGAPHGKKGGAPKGNSNAKKQPQNNTKTTPNDNENDNENDNDIGDSKESPCRAKKPDAIVPYQKIMDFWNRAMENKPIKGISAITPNSRRGINVRARFKEHGEEKIYRAIMNASESSFLNGYISTAFTATFDWVFLPSNFVKVLDGNYQDQQNERRNKNEVKQGDRLSERRGTEPSAKSRKGFNGTF